MFGAKAMTISLLSVIAVGAHGASAPVLRVDGKVLTTRPAPAMRGGRFCVPITTFRQSPFRDIGLGVKWTRGQRSGEVYWQDSDGIFIVTAGQSWSPGQVAGSRIELPGTPFMGGDMLMVPLRTPIGDAPSAAFQVDWDAGSRTANVRRSKSLLRELHRADAVRSAAELDDKGDWRGAVALLRSQARVKPFPWSDVWHSRAEMVGTYSALGSILVHRRPDSGEGYFYLGLAAATQGSYSKALRQFRRGLELDPRNPDLAFAVGWSVLREEGAQSSVGKSADRLRAAMPYFRSALAIDPNHRAALASLAYANLQLGERVNNQGGYTWRSRAAAAGYLTSATRYFERLLRLEPQSRRTREVLLNTYLQTGQAEKYLALSGAPAKRSRAFTYFESGRFATKPLSDLRKTEQEATAGGHMAWRLQPALVASMLIYYGLPADHRPRPTEKQTTHGNWVDLGIDRPGEHTTITTARVRASKATVEITTNGVLDATVRLERPVGSWWYVVSFEFERQAE